MNDERLRWAETALRQVPEDYRKVDAADVAGQERGHSFHQGMHIGWAWGEDERGRLYLDFLSEHRHPGMHAERFYSDGSTEPIRTPASMRAVSPDPAEDAELERKFFEDNQAAYADLRIRGLLPPEGENIGSQEINEYLLKGSSRTEGNAPEEPELARYDRREELLGGGWDEVLRDEMVKPYWRKLLAFVAVERNEHPVYPPPKLTFRAFELTPYDDVRVVILGQDPYPNEGEAHGLAFSVPADVQPKPGSLRNIHKVLESDLSATLDRVVKAPDHGSLEAWAEQGVLLLNTALTVRAGNKEDRDTHRLWRWKKQGWTTFTDAVIRAVNEKADHVVFVLWGNDAKKKEKLIDTRRHAVIRSSHPSPNFGAADLGFLASRPFSQTNEKLRMAGRGEVDWLRTFDGA
jgi:uracil-DNA glycosylase